MFNAQLKYELNREILKLGVSVSSQTIQAKCQHGERIYPAHFTWQTDERVSERKVTDHLD